MGNNFVGPFSSYVLLAMDYAPNWVEVILTKTNYAYSRNSLRRAFLPDLACLNLSLVIWVSILLIGLLMLNRGGIP